ncbi:FYN-binding protein 1 isoform X2 [Salarias fasciatus]|uniref:FYN-binding protein 1 n=1 Tax=Salarias fasciatus TaxID=181472 RepID=A0A672JB57_SALFA|nr:FYN-binding protein 1 isoform X2 [Salarias fasciatus]
MDNKSDVKAIMARFQASGASTDETSSTPGGRPKQPLHSTLSSGSAVQKKPVFESLSGSATNATPKANFLKNTASSKSDTDTHEINKTKAIASRFANLQDDGSNKPFAANKPLKPEQKTAVQKSPFNKPSLTSTASESKPLAPKPSLTAGPKPSWVKADTGGAAAPNASSTPPKVPSAQHKPSSSIGKLKQQTDDTSGSSTDAGSKSSLNSAPKPQSNFRAAQNMFNKEKAEQADSGGSSKPPLVTTNSSTPPPKPLASKKPSLKKPPAVSSLTGSVNGNAAAGPKRKPLPNTFNLGPAPAKPNRPPKVNLESFKRGAESSGEGPGFKKPTPLTPTASHSSNHSNNMTPSQPAAPAVPSLPPRHPGATNQQQEDFYDDVEELISAPPPLPPSAGHPSQRAKEEQDADDNDGEMYEDLEDRWDAAEQKKREKAEKEEKKRLEAEKKEQKEREKREQDLKKKFKLVGPLEVIHQGKARSDCKGSKTDLALKQGDRLDIIRVQGNPEGRWLGRTADGSIGYVKTTSVEIDFNTLKSRQAQQSYEPEVYDDIDVVSSGSSGNSGVVLPPPPGDGEIYDDCVDPNLEVRVPPPSQFTAEGPSDQLGGPIDEEIYDDVDSQGPLPPPPPPISSLPGMKGKGRTDEMDPRKQKKFEKEEKEFRKKFKFDREIQSLYQVTIVHSLTNKKWGPKELSIKAGETLDVISKEVDNKLICRNEDGKFGYVSTAHIVMDDGDIYDDIGDDCIYDND